jgi:RNA polymerase sigma-70 factor, ECF subfamily
VTRRRARPQEIDLRGSTRPGPQTNETSLHMNSESTMVLQAIAGNADARELLFAARTNRLIRTAFGILGNREDAEDALQDGLFQAYSKLHSFEGRSSFSSWLTRIVINAALMIRRRKGARPELSLDKILESQAERYPRGTVDARSDPEKIYAANEIKALIERQVRKLPPELQQEYRLRVINGLSAAESGRGARHSIEPVQVAALSCAAEVDECIARVGLADYGVGLRTRECPRPGFSELDARSNDRRNIAWEE